MKRKERPSYFLLDLSDVAVDQCQDINSAIIIIKMFCVERSTLLKDTMLSCNLMHKGFPSAVMLLTQFTEYFQ